MGTLALCAQPQARPAVPTISADAVLEQQLSQIDALLARKSYPEAIQAAISGFNLDASNCRGIDTHIINARDEYGNDVVAHTQLDQVVTLDPRFTAFKSARYLVTILAHELTHCDQNQHLYTLALALDHGLAPLKDKLPLLRVTAELDELAGVAVKNSPAKSDALVKYKQLAAKHGFDLAPERLLELTRRFLDDAQTYKRTLGDLQEMEACLRAFELPGVIPPPRGKAKAREEFAFQYRFLLLSTNRFLKARQLFGATPETTCKLANYVPFEMMLNQERTCVESVRFVKDFLDKVPE